MASGLSAAPSLVSSSTSLRDNPAANSDRSQLHALAEDATVPPVLASFPSRHNAFSGMANSAKPQSRQTESLGNTKTGGLSRFLSPERWTLISELNFRWFSERQDLHTISFTPREAKIENEPKLAMSECALLPTELCHPVC